MDTKRLIMAMLGAVVLYFATLMILSVVDPPPPAPPPGDQPTEREILDDSPTTPQPEIADDGAEPDSIAEADPDAGPDEQPTLRAPRRGTYAWQGGDATDPIVIGADRQLPLKVRFSPQGATVDAIWLTARESDDPDARFRFRESPESEEPYQLLRPVESGAVIHRSFKTARITIKEHDDRRYPLGDLAWERVAETEDPNTIAFAARLVDQSDSTPLLELIKRYRLDPEHPLMTLELEARNRSDQPLTVTLVQDGGVGIQREQFQWDQRRLFVGAHNQQSAVIAESFDHGTLYNATLAHLQNPENPLPTLTTTPEQELIWTSLTNRFFGLFLRPLMEASAGMPDFPQVQGLVAAPQLAKSVAPGDMVARHILPPLELDPQGSGVRRLEVYAGPKDTDRLAAANPRFADATQLGYIVAQYADRFCVCTFDWLTRFMTVMLHWIHAGIPNYGVAIIILVILVRSLLHPLTVFQQRAMFKTQEGMAHIQPKMQAIKDKYPNDRQKQNQEIMKLMSDEGVNPLANFVGMVPMIIQMPILVALWQGLNADVELRHAPFVAWIQDLSSPDQLLRFQDVFGADLTIPLLGWIFPSIFANIEYLNFLPLIMGVSMYLQQKYMPKPALQQKREQAKNRAEESGKTSQFEQQMKQQQTIMAMMSIIFPLMFYYMPSGLTLYWLATNVFGICETLIIRRQIDREKAARAARGDQPAPKRKRAPGFISKAFAKMAEQAEELQRKADELSQQEAAKKGKKPPADAPPPRYRGKREKKAKKR
jgi:YidC/Oxa1 family membrane protein insertase